MFFRRKDDVEPESKEAPVREFVPESRLDPAKKPNREPDWQRQQSRYFAAKVEALQGRARRLYLFPPEGENSTARQPERFPGAGGKSPGSAGIALWVALAVLTLAVLFPVGRLLFAGVPNLQESSVDQVIFWYQAAPEDAVQIVKTLQDGEDLLDQPVKPLPVQALGQSLAAVLQENRKEKVAAGSVGIPDLVLLDPFTATYFLSHRAFLLLEPLVKAEQLEDPAIFTPLPLIAGRYVLAIPKNARHPEAAWKVLKYLVKNLPRQIPSLINSNSLP
ncbi:MAG: extracellular solute-binding protein [Firmicutes bacterium]|nr:extracellular solute-binding protein [Bacillota bacterium]